MATSTLRQLPARHPSSGRRQQCLPSSALELIPWQWIPLFSRIYPSWLCFSQCPEVPWRGLSWGHPCRGARCCCAARGLTRHRGHRGTAGAHRAPTKPPNQPQDCQKGGGEAQQGKAPWSLKGNPWCCTAPGLAPGSTEPRPLLSAGLLHSSCRILGLQE